jgi:hypothetical protein
MWATGERQAAKLYSYHLRRYRGLWQATRVRHPSRRGHFPDTGRPYPVLQFPGVMALACFDSRGATTHPDPAKKASTPYPLSQLGTIPNSSGL